VATNHRGRRGWLVVLVAIAIGGWLILHCQGDPAPTTEAHTAAPAPAPPAPVHELVLHPGAGAPPRAGADAPAEKPVIDEVTVEKPEVCEGEDNLITVRAHTPGNTDDGYLHAVIAGSPGMRVPVTTFRRRDGSIEPRQILVFGRGDEPTVVDLPAFEVKDCMVDRRLLIDYRLRPNTEAELDLGARIMGLGKTTPFVPASFHWDFGDGTTADTTEAWTAHSFEDRPQDTLYAALLVTVTATARDGERVVGRTTIVLQNPAYANLVYAGVVSLSVRLTPRFPVIGKDGKVHETVRLWHHRREPVMITKVVRRLNYKDHRPPEQGEVAVSSLLPSPWIPRTGVDVKVELDAAHDPDLYSIDYRLDGTSAEGLPVQGIFPVMAPPELPTKEHHDKIRDPALLARVIRARELLGKPYVTDEEIWALERRGAFDDLPPTGQVTPPSSTPTYGDLPPHPPRPGEPPPGQPLPSADTMPVDPQGLPGAGAPPPGGP